MYARDGDAGERRMTGWAQRSGFGAGLTVKDFIGQPSVFWRACRRRGGVARVVAGLRRMENLGDFVANSS